MNDPPKKIKKFKKTIDKLKNKCYTMYVIKVRQKAKKGIDTMKKITKKEMFAQILTHLTDENEIAFINHEIELLNNKASGTRKPTANQVANETFKQKILEILNVDIDKALSITEIQEKSEELSLLTNQRISALLTQLKKDNLVERIVGDKRKVMFRVVGE